MTEEEYEKAKIELKEKKWKFKHLIDNDSFTQHMKMQIGVLEAIISNHEDCYYINKPVIQNLLISTKVLK